MTTKRHAMLCSNFPTKTLDNSNESCEMFRACVFGTVFVSLAWHLGFTFN